MIDSKYRISLDVNSTTSNVRLKCKRGDTGRTIYAALTESGYPYHITDDCYAVFTATKPDGKKVYNGCKIEGCMIVYELTPQTVAVPGLVKCEIKLYGANDKLITSASFLLEVCNAQVNDGDELESATEVEALTQLISQAIGMTVKLETLPNFGSGAKVGDYLMVSEVDKEKRMVTVIPTDAPADLSGYAKIEQLPKNTSDLNNDSGFVTRLVADLANYYAKSETYNREEIDQKIGTIPKFSIKVVQSLPAQDINETTVYLLAEGNETGDLYSEWIYANGKWELLGSQRVDLTGYAKETWVDQKLTDYALATAVPKKVSQLQNDAGYLTEHQDISGIRSIAEEAMRMANSRLVAPKSASVGQYFRVKEVDENGFITEVEAVDPPTGGGYGGGDLDMAGSVIDYVGALSFNPVDDGYSHAFRIQSANDIKNDDGSHTAVAEFYSSESDGPVVLRNIAGGKQDNEAVNLSQLKARLPAPLTASVGQYIQITAIDENGLVTAVEAVDEPSGDSLAIVSPETAQVGQTIVVKSVDENGKPTAWEAADFPKSKTSHVWETEPTTEEVSEITYNLGNSLELSNQLVNADTVVLTIHLKAPAAESTDATKRGVVNAGIYIPKLTAWGWIPFKDAEACPIPAISYSLTTDLEAVVIHAGKEKAAETESVGWLRRYGLQSTVIYPKNQNIINGGTQINGLSAYKVTPDTIRDMELKVTSSTPIGVGSYVRLEVY